MTAHSYVETEVQGLGVWIGWEGEAVRLVRESSEEQFCAEYQRRFGVQPQRTQMAPPAAYALPGISEFQRQVLAVVAEIPSGKALSYGEVARRVGRARAARAVGQAVAANPVPLLIPCHRVLPASGGIGGYSLGGSEVKRRLLEAEGICL